MASEIHNKMPNRQLTLRPVFAYTSGLGVCIAILLTSNHPGLFILASSILAALVGLTLGFLVYGRLGAIIGAVAFVVLWAGVLLYVAAWAYAFEGIDH